MKYIIKIESEEFSDSKRNQEIDARYDSIIKKLNYLHQNNMISEEDYLDIMDAVYNMRQIEKEGR